MEDYKGTRKVLRRELNASVKVKVHESSAGEVKLLENELESKTSNISDGGLGILCPIYIPEGTRLQIELDSTPFYSEKKDPIDITAKVTSSVMSENGYRTGLQFIEVSDQDKEAIIKYVQS